MKNYLILLTIRLFNCIWFIFAIPLMIVKVSIWVVSDEWVGFDWYADFFDYVVNYLNSFIK